MKHKFLLTIYLIFFSNLTFADAYVCKDRTGKKTFSEAPCEKNGLIATPSEFSVDTAQSVQPVYVVTTEVTPADGSVRIKPATVIEQKLNTWAGYVPITGVMFFLLALMPIAAISFLGFHLIIYIRARLRKFVHVKSSMPKSRE